MVAKLDVVQVETGTNPEDSKYNPGQEYTRTTFLDGDIENRLTAFLKWSDPEGRKLKPGQSVNFAVTGLRPVKEDKSSYYLSGAIVK